MTTVFYALGTYVVAFALATMVTFFVSPATSISSTDNPLAMTHFERSLWFSVSSILSAPFLEPWDSASAVLYIVYAAIAIVLNVIVFAIITAKFMRCVLS